APENASVSLPAGAIAGQCAGQVGDPAVDAELDPLAARISVMVRRLRGRAEGVVESAGCEKACEGAQPGQAILADRLVQTGMAEARGALRAQGRALVFERAEVEGAVEKDAEDQPGAG